MLIRVSRRLHDDVVVTRRNVDLELTALSHGRLFAERIDAHRGGDSCSAEGADQPADLPDRQSALQLDVELDLLTYCDLQGADLIAVPLRGRRDLRFASRKIAALES